MINVRNVYNEVLDVLLRKGKISQQTFWKLDPIGCIPVVLYGLSKVHNSLLNGPPKMRPILSAIGSASYNLFKFLVPILSCLVNGPYTIVNSFSFNKKVQQQDPTLVMGSLDVDRRQKEKKLNNFLAFLTQNCNAPLEVKEKVLESCILQL